MKIKPAMMTSSLLSLSFPTMAFTILSKPINEQIERTREKRREKNKDILYIYIEREEAKPPLVAAEHIPTRMLGSAMASSISERTPGRATATSSTITL